MLFGGLRAPPLHYCGKKAFQRYQRKSTWISGSIRCGLGVSAFIGFRRGRLALKPVRVLRAVLTSSDGGTGWPAAEGGGPRTTNRFSRGRRSLAAQREIPAG